MSTQTTERIEAPEQKLRMASFRHVLKNRQFLLLWVAQLISLTVLNAANFGIIVLVQEVTASVFMVGVAIIAFTLPAVPFSAIAGVFVDRMYKRRVLWVSNVLRVVTMLLIVASLLHDRTNLLPLFALVFMTSLIGQFFIPAEGAAIPLLVGKRDLMAALSLFNISLTLSQAIGFLLLGRVVATIFPPFSLSLGALTLHVESIDMLFVVSALLYALCAILVLCIPSRAFAEQHRHAQKNSAARDMHLRLGHALQNLWRDMVEGWRIVRADRLLFYSVIQLSVVGIIMLLIGQLAGTFVVMFLHRPAEDMVVILAPAGVGLVGASILMPRIVEFIGKIHLTITGFVALSVGFLALPAVQWSAVRLDPQHGAQSPWLFWTVVVLVFLLGVAMACVNIPTNTMMQERAPEVGRARVLSLQYMLYNTGSIPILLFAGAIAQFIGFTQLIVLVSVSLLLFCGWGAWYVKDHKRQGYQNSEQGGSPDKKRQAS